MLEDYLKELNSGHKDSSGQFTLDPSVARERFGSLLEREPALPLLRAIQAAVAAEAGGISIGFQDQACRLTCRDLKRRPEDPDSGSAHEHWRALLNLVGVFELNPPTSGETAFEFVIPAPKGRLLGPWKETIRSNLDFRCSLSPVPIVLESQLLNHGSPERIGVSQSRMSARPHWLAEHTVLGQGGFSLAPMGLREAAIYRVGTHEYRWRGTSEDQPVSLYHCLTGKLGELTPLVVEPLNLRALTARLSSLGVVGLGFALLFAAHPIAGTVISLAGVSSAVRSHQHGAKTRRFQNLAEGSYLLPGHVVKGPSDLLSPITYPWDQLQVSGWNTEFWLGLAGRPLDVVTFYPYKDGLLLDPKQLHGHPPGGTVVARVDGPTDLSGLQLIHTGEVEALEQKALKQLRGL